MNSSEFPTRAPDDYPQTTATTGTVAPGGATTGVIGASGDIDWFKVTLVAGQYYTVDLKGAPTSSGSLADPCIKGIMNSAGTLVAGTWADGGGAGLNSREVFRAASSGTYYIAAGATGTGTGSYTLAVSHGDDCLASTATVSVVAPGSGKTGAIETAGDVDWIKVTLVAGQNYAISLQGASTSGGTLADPCIKGIMNSAGTLVTGTWADGGGVGLNSREIFTPATSGSYYIAAGGKGTATGTYTLAVSKADDFLAGTATTGVVAPGSAKTGAIETAGDVDWFKVTLVAGKNYTLDLKGAPTSNGTLADPCIKGVYNSAGVLVAGSAADGGGTGLNSREIFTAATSGTYYIAAGATGTGTGTYTLAVSKADDYRAGTGTTGVVAPGSGQTGSIETAGDTDWFKVTLVAGQNYTFNLKGAATSNGTLADPCIKGVYNSAGVLVTGTWADGGGTGLNSREIFTPASSGTYYIAAGATGTGTGTYTLAVSAADDYRAGTGTTGAVAVGGSTTGAIETAGDTDWFKVTLAAGQNYSLDLKGEYTASGSLADPCIKGVYNSAGVLVAGSAADNGGLGLNSHETFTATSAGTYYIAAGATGTGTGTYTLSVAPGKPNWGIMAYVDGDNNLEEAAVGDLNQMEAANASPYVSVTALLDRAAGEYYGDGDWTDAREGIVQHDSDTGHVSSLTTDKGELDMGNVATLTSFINWSAQSDPTDSSCLLLWNHGGGVDGVCWDDQSGNNLSIQDVATAITNSTLHHVDMVAFDACLMGVLDQAYALKDCAEIMVASEETVPWEGYDYTSLLNGFSAGGTHTGTDLAQEMVQTYDASYTEPVTLSAIDLNKVDALVSSMSSFAQAWRNSGDNGWVLVQACNSAERYDSGYGDNVDLVSYMHAVQNFSSSTTLDNAAQAVINAAGNAVIANGGGMADSSGISLYMPWTNSGTYLNGTGQPLVAATGWTDLYQAVWDY